MKEEPLFFSTRDTAWCPTLRLLHKYPDMMPKLRVDTGAIRFVLSGADIMCPGLTSAGATIHEEVRSSHACTVPMCKENAWHVAGTWVERKSQERQRPLTGCPCAG